VGGDERVMGPVGHTVLSVVLDGADWHVDVGVGNFGPRGPLPLVDGAETATGPWEYRVERTDTGHWLLRLRRPEGWFNLMQFTEERYYRADIATHNYVASTDPGSPFTQQIIVQHNGDEVRRSLNGLTLTSYRPGGERTRREITPDELPETLSAVFGLDLPEEHLRALVAFARTSARSPWVESLSA